MLLGAEQGDGIGDVVDGGWRRIAAVADLVVEDCLERRRKAAAAVVGREREADVSGGGQRPVPLGGRLDPLAGVRGRRVRGQP